MAKTIKPIVTFNHVCYVFDSVDAAAAAIKFFGKLRRVELAENGDEIGYHYRPIDKPSQIQLETHEFREKPKRLGLPSPKRGVVPCQVCESVSVVPGKPCESCGTVAPTDH